MNSSCQPTRRQPPWRQQCSRSPRASSHPAEGYWHLAMRNGMQPSNGSFICIQRQDGGLKIWMRGDDGWIENPVLRVRHSSLDVKWVMNSKPHNLKPECKLLALAPQPKRFGNSGLLETTIANGHQRWISDYFALHLSDNNKYEVCFRQHVLRIRVGRYFFTFLFKILKSENGSKNATLSRYFSR